MSSALAVLLGLPSAAKDLWDLVTLTLGLRAPASVRTTVVTEIPGRASPPSLRVTVRGRGRGVTIQEVYVRLVRFPNARAYPVRFRAIMDRSAGGALPHPVGQTLEAGEERVFHVRLDGVQEWLALEGLQHQQELRVEIRDAKTRKVAAAQDTFFLGASGR